MCAESAWFAIAEHIKNCKTTDRILPSQEQVAQTLEQLLHTYIFEVGIT